MEESQRKQSVVFLDVDGVLNTRRTCVHAPSGIYVGVDEARVFILSKAIKENYMDGVVLTSTWKNMRENEEDYIYLINSLDKYGIKVLGKTEEKRTAQRAEGILDYLELYPEVEEYVILDDQHYSFRDYRKLWESFIDTQAKGIEHSVTASKTPSVTAILFLNSVQKYAGE